MAGLPKAAFLLILTLGIAMTFAIASVADEVQTDSVVLQSVFDLIDANLYANPIDQANLEASFEDAITMGVLTPEEALAMLELVQWETLVETDDLSNVSAALQTILDDLVFGTLTDDPLVELTKLLNVLSTPEGTLTAIGKAGASEEILDQVSSIVASGVPPGILVQITKKALRDDLDVAAQLAALVAALAEEGEDVSWGTVAHDITGEGEYQDQEQNENIDGSEEPEEEINVHGDANAGTDDDGATDDTGDEEDTKDKKDKKDK